MLRIVYWTQINDNATDWVGMIVLSNWLIDSGDVFKYSFHVFSFNMKQNVINICECTPKELRWFWTGTGNHRYYSCSVGLSSQDLVDSSVLVLVLHSLLTFPKSYFKQQRSSHPTKLKTVEGYKHRVNFGDHECRCILRPLWQFALAQHRGHKADGSNTISMYLVQPVDSVWPHVDGWSRLRLHDRPPPHGGSNAPFRSGETKKKKRRRASISGSGSLAILHEQVKCWPDCRGSGRLSRGYSQTRRPVLFPSQSRPVPPVRPPWPSCFRPRGTRDTARSARTSRWARPSARRLRKAAPTGGGWADMSRTWHIRHTHTWHIRHIHDNQAAN